MDKIRLMPFPASVSAAAAPACPPSAAPATAEPPGRVAVVLGAALRADGSPTPALARRVARGVDLLTGGTAGLLLLSGGGAHPRRREAEAMAELALTLGAPPHALLLETRSANTRGNARHSLTLLATHHARLPDRVIIVSDLWHLPRAWLCFAVAVRRLDRASGIPGRRPRLGLAATAARPASLGWWRGLVREAPALLADAVRVWRR